MISDIVQKIQDAEQEASGLVEKARTNARAIGAKASEKAAEYASEQEKKARADAAKVLTKAESEAKKSAEQVLAKKAGESEALGKSARKNIDKAVSYIVERVG